MKKKRAVPLAILLMAAIPFLPFACAAAQESLPVARTTTVPEKSPEKVPERLPVPDPVRVPEPAPLPEVTPWKRDLEAERLAFDRLQGFLSGMSTLEANFVQRVENPSPGTPEESTGRFSARRPGLFRWDYETPFKQMILADGRHIYFYEADLQQVTVAGATRLNETPAAFFTSDQPLETVFTWSVHPDPVWNHPMVRLRPKMRGDIEYIDVLVSPDGERLLKISTMDALGNLSHFHFSGLAMNAEIPAERFEFQPPPGVDVVHAGDVNP